jgi:branched-subunit amino acid transport protein
MDMLLVILGAALVTFLPRVLPLMLLSRLDLPEWVERWLHYVPVSVMAALIAQELFTEDGKISLHWPEICAALPAVIFAVWKRSLLGTVLAGMLAIMAIRWFW